MHKEQPNGEYQLKKWEATFAAAIVNVRQQKQSRKLILSLYNYLIN